MRQRVEIFAESPRNGMAGFPERPLSLVRVPLADRAAGFGLWSETNHN